MGPEGLDRRWALSGESLPPSWSLWAHWEEHELGQHTSSWEKMCEGGTRSQETVSYHGILELGMQTALECGQVIWLL